MWHERGTNTLGRTDIKVSKSDKLFIKTDIITCMMIQWSVLLFLTALLCYLSIWFLIPMTCIFIVSCFSDITEKILLVCQPNKHYIIVDRETIILKRWKEIKTYNHKSRLWENRGIDIIKTRSKFRQEGIYYFQRNERWYCIH